MRFIHIADVHLGADPSIGNECRGERGKEIWVSLERVLEICERHKAELLLIAGDLFHRQPLMRELKEVNYMFGRLSITQVVIIAGNHDYLKKESYYRTFNWAANVHMILTEDISCVEFPEYSLAVYGLSYHAKERLEDCYSHALPQGRQMYEILLAHGGDEKHIPVKKEELLRLGYDYIALGHIHKPCVFHHGKAAYSGALEPIDKNDTGIHGYIEGEITEKGVNASFVPAASREYVHMEVAVGNRMTGYELREKLYEKIAERGTQNIYKIILTGQHDPDIVFDLDDLDSCGNIIEIVDQTTPAYQFEKLWRQNRENVFGQFIESFRGSKKGSIEYQALCEGVHALMETRRG